MCNDSWENCHTYDISQWHNDWQQEFPKDNQEIPLKLGDARHRADILVGNTVVEFQHSIMSGKAFEDRNNFYHNLGYKVVWLFDMTDLFESGEILCTNKESNLLIQWNNPKKAFKEHAFRDDNVDLFFQISNTGEKCIIRVLETSEFGFEKFTATRPITKDAFLSYVGLVDGICAKPFIVSFVSGISYKDYKNKYCIKLNQQQERALQTIEGANLLLAVPGSGKTTVLVDRLGYMTTIKGIAPKRILAIAYNKDAAVEMKARFSAKYGTDLGNRIRFQTINSLAFRIYIDYWQRIDKNPRTLITDDIQQGGRKSLVTGALKAFVDYPTEGEILDLGGAISYIKNMQLSSKEIREMEENMPHLSKMYELYNESLEQGNYMDFDDQLIFAYCILKSNPDVLEIERAKYKYICVDEAQDASKVQHKIIQMLAEGNNIFMVGDEDQSIYGFRGAFPQAFLNFKYDYRNPYILRMETNYRSTPQITDLAQRFISKNKGRYNKTMVTARESGEDVELHKCVSRSDQYNYLLAQAKNCKSETAFLYRNNESSVILVDLFLRNNILFNLHKPEFDIFNTRIVQDIIAFFKFAIDPTDVKSLKQIINHGILYLTANQIKCAVGNAYYNHVDIYDALEAQMKYNKGRKNTDRAEKFRKLMKKIAQLPPYQAISELCQAGYADYVSENGLGETKLDMIKMLAKNEESIKGFLERIDLLRNILKTEIKNGDSNSVTLSTIHTSKGKEYDTVYLLDVFDGYFPSSNQSIVTKAKDAANGEQEERRLFYVGLTRAKNKLVICKIEHNRSSFIEELFPEAVPANPIRMVSSARPAIIRVAEEQFKYSSSTEPPMTLTTLIRDCLVGDTVNVRDVTNGLTFKLQIVWKDQGIECNRFESSRAGRIGSFNSVIWPKRNDSIWVKVK